MSKILFDQVVEFPNSNGSRARLRIVQSAADSIVVERHDGLDAMGAPRWLPTHSVLLDSDALRVYVLQLAEFGFLPPKPRVDFVAESE